MRDEMQVNISVFRPLDAGDGAPASVRLRGLADEMARVEEVAAILGGEAEAGVDAKWNQVDLYILGVPAARAGEAVAMLAARGFCDGEVEPVDDDACSPDCPCVVRDGVRTALSGTGFQFHG